MRKKLGAQTPNLKQHQIETRLPSRGGRGPAGSGVVRGVLSGLQVGAPCSGGALGPRHPPASGRAWGAKALRGSGSRPESLGTTRPFPWARGAGCGVPQPRARRGHGADALPAERQPGEPLAPGPHVARAPCPAAVLPPPSPQPRAPGLGGGLAACAGCAGTRPELSPTAPLGHRRGEEGRFFSPLPPWSLRVLVPHSRPPSQEGAPRVPGVTARFVIPNANNRPPAAAGRSCVALRSGRGALPGVTPS